MPTIKLLNTIGVTSAIGCQNSGDCGKGVIVRPSPNRGKLKEPAV